MLCVCISRCRAIVRSSETAAAAPAPCPSPGDAQHQLASPCAWRSFRTASTIRLASAAALTPEELYGDPERVLWPLVGAGLQGALLFAPVVAAVLAAGSSYAVEQAIISPWKPAAPSETEIEEACARAEKYFQVTAPPERAGPRAAAFRAAADRWRDDRRADERRDYYRAAATAGSAAAADSCLAKKFFSASEAFTKMGKRWKSGTVPLSIKTMGTLSRSFSSTYA